MNIVSALEAFKNREWSFFDEHVEFENARISRYGSIVLIVLHELSDVYVFVARSTERARMLVDIVREMRRTHNVLILPELMNHISICEFNDMYDDKHTYIFIYECSSTTRCERTC